MTCQSCGKGEPLLNGKICYECDSQAGQMLFRSRMSYGDFLVQMELDRLDYEKALAEEKETPNGD